VVPFGFQPNSVSVKTGSYTIPSGYYAYVTAYCDEDGSFSVGGTVALAGQDDVARTTSGSVEAVTAVAVGGTGSTYSYTVSSGYIFSGNVFFSSNSGTQTLSIGGVQVMSCGSANTGASFDITVGSSDVITVTSSGSGTLGIAGASKRINTLNITESIAGTPTVGSFWIPTGTALTVSSATYTVSLFPNLS
jgi:hypothetical protein